MKLLFLTIGQIIVIAFATTLIHESIHVTLCNTYGVSASITLRACESFPYCYPCTVCDSAEVSNLSSEERIGLYHVNQTLDSDFIAFLELSADIGLMVFVLKRNLRYQA
jgi:hypothetical protein